MITEKTIREAYLFLREKNNSIPDETLDFMLHASLEKLKEDATAPIMLEALQEAKLQIEYLHWMFKATGTGNAVIAKIDNAIKKASL